MTRPCVIHITRHSEKGMEYNNNNNIIIVYYETTRWFVMGFHMEKVCHTPRRVMPAGIERHSFRTLLGVRSFCRPCHINVGRFARIAPVRGDLM